MPLLVINADMKFVGEQLKRIADKLDRIWPEEPILVPTVLVDSDIVQIGEVTTTSNETELWHAYAPRQNPHYGDK